MIYSTVSQWLDGKFIAFNESLAEADKLQMIDVNLDTGFLPASLKDKKYIIKFTGIEDAAIEAEQYTVNVEIEFQFSLFRKPLVYYQKIIDEYLFRFLRILQDDAIWGLEFESHGITLTNIRNPAITGLDKQDKGGKYLMPVIEFQLEAIVNI